MSNLRAAGSGSLDLVLVMAPYRQDAEYLRRLVIDEGSPAAIVAENELAERLEQTPGVLLVTHEALSSPVREILAAHLEAQPSWAELPVVILLDRSAPVEKVRTMLDEAWPRARLMFYQRPVTHLELLSGIQSAMLSRLHQREVRDHIEREMELRRELNHRVKNLLASVTSIFAMTKRNASGIEDLSQDFGGRLKALARVHEVAHAAEGPQVALSEIIDVTLEPYRDGEERIVSQVAEIMLDRDTATTLALCLHELATNAIKYGALAEPGGRVTVSAAIEEHEGPELHFSWEEADGPAALEPEGEGYGTRYIRTALTALMGQPPRFEFRPSGLLFSASAPLDRLQ